MLHIIYIYKHELNGLNRKQSTEEFQPQEILYFVLKILELSEIIKIILSIIKLEEAVMHILKITVEELILHYLFILYYFESVL
jgi:hypothetical protein